MDRLQNSKKQGEHNDLLQVASAMMRDVQERGATNFELFDDKGLCFGFQLNSIFWYIRVLGTSRVAEVQTFPYQTRGEFLDNPSANKHPTLMERFFRDETCASDAAAWIDSVSAR